MSEGISQGAWIDLIAQPLCGGFVVGDVEDEVVAEQSLWVLHLDEVDAGRRELLQPDAELFAIAGFDRPVDLPAIDDQVGAAADMPSPLIVIVRASPNRIGNCLPAALSVDSLRASRVLAAVSRGRHARRVAR